MISVDISIVMTVKNGQNTIGATIKSILQQTFNNFELIIINDGSSDDTAKIIKNFHDNRIKFYDTDGVGRSKALNLALKHCSGNYICNNDVDDPMHPQRLELEYNFLEKNFGYDLVCTKSQIIFDDSMPTWEKYDHLDLNIWEDISKSNLLKKNPISHSSIMLRKSETLVIEYDESLKCNVDYNLWLFLAFQSVKMAKLPIKLASKRIHSGQSFENKNRINYLKTSLQVQLNGIKKLEGSYQYYLWAYVKFFYGLFPQSLRMKLINSTNKK